MAALQRRRSPIVVSGRIQRRLGCDVVPDIRNVAREHVIHVVREALRVALLQLQLQAVVPVAPEVFIQIDAAEGRVRQRCLQIRVVPGGGRIDVWPGHQVVPAAGHVRCGDS